MSMLITEEGRLGYLKLLFGEETDKNSESDLRLLFRIISQRVLYVY